MKRRGGGMSSGSTNTRSKITIEEFKSMLLTALKEDKRFAEEVAEIVFNYMADRIVDVVSEQLEVEEKSFKRGLKS
ncbi:hypothetical protein DSO05_05355 [Candidatus Nezhaarchaeota archaeon WYZ-LMO7]|nr:MAG: hypothetical protein DSO05_05355 [Candidatus Nezhaarchaeota archaeon WYZ-LMO7]